MLTSGRIAPGVLWRARADQVDTLYGQWHRTTVSMALGAALLCTVLWQTTTSAAMLGWIAAIMANQAWRGGLVRRYRRRDPGVRDSARWGLYWSIGSTLAGALWGIAAVAMFPGAPAHQALLIVCLFGVVLGGLNLTAVYKPAFYGFVASALLPLVARVAWEGDEVHLFTALVLLVVLAFVLTYGHHLNDLLTHSLAMRYENTDLIVALTAQSAAAEQSRAAAENANRAKSQFLAAASHDLRQPLHAMGLFAAALAARVRDPTVTPLVQSIHASVEALESLFAQLLDLSRLEGGALHPEVRPVALESVLARMQADFAPQAEAAGLALRVRMTSATVLTDPLLLERMLRNLVANAIRYTQAGGIVVGMRRCGSEVRLDVVDSGVGIAAADQERVFDEFVQIPGAAGRLRRGHGMGLGLAIVRRLSDLLDHRLELASMPGHGSRFSIILPRAAAHRARGGQAPLPAAATATAHTASPQPFAGRRVAIIDDDRAVIAAMEALFATWGARVTGAEDAAALLVALEAEPLAKDHPIDIVIADLRLAEQASGLDAIATLRSATGKDIPALVISGDTTDEAREEVARAGVSLLHKPVMATTLLLAAQRALSARASQPRRAAVFPAVPDRVIERA